MASYQYFRQGLRRVHSSKSLGPSYQSQPVKLAKTSSKIMLVLSILFPIDNELIQNLSSSHPNKK